MTPEKLAEFDGSDPAKPVLLAINGTIYDVSSGRRIYGDGGSYNHFAGVDASRAYVTGCFAEDRTPDMRGVEEMFIPVDNPEIDSHWTPQELEEMRKQEIEQAKEKAHKALKHWVDFFDKHEKYIKVGYVQREPGWLEKLEKRELCTAAQKSRPKRKIPKKA
jgi:predicted heme/steroid binding protein